LIPVVFSGNRGWLYLPQEKAPSREAIVFFPAFGVEDLATRSSLARLACSLAEAGHPVLRFDLPGTGDSLGDWENGASINAWVEAGQQAVHAIRRWSGSRPTSLLGLRLGGLIASLVAQKLQEEGDSIAGLALLAPIFDGRQYMRELRALSDGSSPLTIAGFPINEELRQTVAAITPGQFTKPLAQRIFLGVPNTGKHLTDLEPRWRENVPVNSLPYPDLAEHIGNPTMSRAPVEMFRQLQEWFGALPPVSSAAKESFIGKATLTGDSYQEEGEVLAVENGLAGIWCNPLQALPNTPIVIFCNAGRNPHTGWARSAVSLARRLAEHGIASLRFDLAGLGDSPVMEKPPEELLYSKAGIPQLRAVLDAVEQRHGTGRAICLVGACSGGYLAFHEAVHDPRVGSLVLVNVQRFIWQAGTSLQASMRTGGRSTTAYRQRAFSLDTWKRLFRGDVNLGTVTRVLAMRGWDGALQAASRQGRQLVSLLRKTSGNEQNPASDTPSIIRENFAAMAGRGTKTTIIYSEEDGGRDEFARYFGADSHGFTRLAGARLVILPETDHDLTPPPAREQLLAEIMARCL